MNLKYVFLLATLAITMSGCVSSPAEDKNTNTTTPQVDISFVGGVVPHHNLISHEIEHFWDELSKRNKPQIIVLIGPDHPDKAKAQIVTTRSKESLLVDMNLDQGLIEPLLASGKVTEDVDVFHDEHSIELHLPFIQRFFPDVAFVPLLVRSDASLEQIQALVELIRSRNTRDIDVVASVDFSHYKTRVDAEGFDQESITAVHNFDFPTLSSFGSEHMDSDQSIIFTSSLVCPEKSCQWETLYHGNSADYPLQDPNVTTSYFSLFLTEKH